MGMIFGNEAKHIAVFGRSFKLNAQVTLQGKFKFFEQIYLLCLYLKKHILKQWPSPTAFFLYRVGQLVSHPAPHSMIFLYEVSRDTYSLQNFKQDACNNFTLNLNLNS